MKVKGALGIGAAFLTIGFVSSTADAQVLIETGRILTPKTKDLGEIIDKASKGPKTISGVQPTSQPSGSSSTARAAARKPADPLAPFSPDTEDPAAVLDINAAVLGRFATALAAESAKREASTSLTSLEYNVAGAEAGSFTSRQYFVLKARVKPFCAAVAAHQAPPNDLTYSYLPGEAQAIKPQCAALLPELIRNM